MKLFGLPTPFVSLVVIVSTIANAQPNQNSCNVASDEAGCFDTTCSDYICRAYEGCCETEWNITCALLATEICRPEIVPFRGTDVNGRLSCPHGYVCDGENRMANCTQLQEAAIELYQVGDVYGGVYCPLGGSDILNCPRGRYCPTPEESLPCPAGHFCPFKSRDPDLFDCEECDEGATEMERDYYGYVIMSLFLFVGIAYILFYMLKRYQKDLFAKLVELQQRKTDSLRLIMERTKQRDNQRLERLRPKLEIISARLDKQSTRTNSSRSSSNRKSIFTANSRRISSKEDTNTSSTTNQFTFDTLQMFRILDANNDQYLSFEELNMVMELNRVELHEFVRRMNELDKVNKDSRQVSKLTFVRHFLQVLEETTHFTVTPEEAGNLFDEIAAMAEVDDNFFTRTRRDASNDLPTEIRPRELYNSSISNYLSDTQINAMIKLFRSASGSPKMMSERPDVLSERESDGDHIKNRRNLASSRITLGQSSKFASMITRADFVEYYPSFLEQVTLDLQPSRLPNEVLNSASADGPTSMSARAKLGVDICFEDLSLTVSVGDSKINVVDHVSGRVQAQTMTALMGGSGAGKTSLLNALCGRAYYGETSGTIHINGQVMEIERIMDRVGFVPQDDVVYAELTVRENLMYAGKFRLPKGTPDRVINDLADDTLASLGLSRVANSMVGDVHRRGVSGGEKKRVNIGLELMACPSILFLDEPTSGLDSSSALLVMQSLKNLVDDQGMTIVSVIHQPRKFIFDLFDSLILLGVGGKMVYHGPVPEARPYFEQRNYVLPLGESLADWLIDISSGRMEPEEVAEEDAITDGSETGDDDDGVEQTLNETQPLVRDATAANQGRGAHNQTEGINDPKSRRAWLYEEWKVHYEALDGEEREIYAVPEQYDVPKSVTKANFFVQLYFQITRAMLVSYRNRFSKIIDSLVVIGAMITICLLEDVVVASRGSDPELDFEEAVRPNNKEIEKFFLELFNYALVPHLSFALKAGLIVAVLIGLQAAKTTINKRVEFFREAASGYDLNAYFLAINIVSTLEHSIQIILASFFSIWIRNPFGSWLSYFVHFLALTWISVSWALFFPQVIPADNVVVVLGFYFAFCGLLLGGAFPPLTYETIYEGGFIELFAGWVSPLRFFIESISVGEYRCMPEQSGLTVHPDTIGFPRDQSAMSIAGMAGHDVNATIRSCSGWYWGVLPSVMVGVTIRFAAAGAMHGFNRGKQTKKPLLFTIKNEKRSLYAFLGFWAVLLGLFGFTCWTMVRDAPLDSRIKEAEEAHREARGTATCFLSGTCDDPLEYFTETTGNTVEDLEDAAEQVNNTSFNETLFNETAFNETLVDGIELNDTLVDDPVFNITI